VIHNVGASLGKEGNRVLHLSEAAYGPVRFGLRQNRDGRGGCWIESVIHPGQR
jgi:hypothetical protein